MKQKRKEKTVEDSIQDFRNIYNKVQNVRKKIKEKSIQKLDLTELDVDDPLHVAEIQRRYEIASRKKAKEKAKWISHPEEICEELERVGVREGSPNGIHGQCRIRKY